MTAMQAQLRELEEERDELKHLLRVCVFFV